MEEGYLAVLHISNESLLGLSAAGEWQRVTTFFRDWCCTVRDAAFLSTLGHIFQGKLQGMG
jgi:hypothetical protein